MQGPRPNVAAAGGCQPAPGGDRHTAQRAVPVPDRLRFVETSGMRLTQKEDEVKVPSWIRVQDCAIVAISSPSRFACPDGKVYTGNELHRARVGS